MRILASLFCICAVCNAATITVDLNGGADYTEIQPAIDAAVDGDTVLVKPGEYVITEPINFNRLHDPVDPASPPVKNITLRGEDGAEVTMIRMAEEPADLDRASVVILESGETEDSVLDGFTLTGGKGTAQPTWPVGGGVLCVGAAPRFANCTITGNSASAGGGACCWQESSPKLLNCTISGNSSNRSNGGGLYSYSSSPELTDCEISGNSAVKHGGGVYCYQSASAVFNNCTISENSAVEEGGGVWLWDSATPRLMQCSITTNSAEHGGGIYCDESSPETSNCIISGNSAAGNGGGIHCSQSSPEITDCIINGNSAANEGGGIYGQNDSLPSITDSTIKRNSARRGAGVYCRMGSPVEIELFVTNCTIADNSAENGGGLYFDGQFRASLVVTDCTIAGNLAEMAGGGVYFRGSSPVLMANCIVWSNAGGAIYHEGDTPALTVRYSCIEDGDAWQGEGTISTDPLFCGWAEGDLQVGSQREFEDALSDFSLSLSPQSPCVGMGENGSDMGADTGICDGAGESSRLIRLSTGSFSVEGGFNLVQNISVEGAGEQETTIEGTVRGLRTGATLSHVTIRGGTEGGIRLGYGEAPELASCTISGNSASSGGGVICRENSHPLLSGCTITENSALSGGGLYCEENSSPVIVDCAITENSASRGGGVYCRIDASPVLKNCTISRNRSDREDGGGVYSVSSSPEFFDCTISENWAAGYGGGVHCYAESSPVLRNCTISENRAIKDGGGVSCTQCSPEITNCTITGNWAANGGGMRCDNWDSVPLITNCLISGNLAEKAGGGNWSYTASPVMTNCTISGNAAEEEGAGVTVHCNSVGFPVIKNSIIWGNATDSLSVSSGNWCQDPSLQVSFSCMEGAEAWPGEGNMNTDPLFVKPGEYDFERFKEINIMGETFQIPDFVVAAGDYHLQRDSPCIDSGTLDGAPERDMESNDRPCLEGVDRGAYEFCGVIPGTRFKRGDANSDEETNIADAIFTLTFLFASGPAPACLDAADANDDGAVDIADAIALLGHLFGGVGPLPDPFRECGMDPTADTLDCVSFAPCSE